MTYSIRYQVFVSSTFTDLREERAEVLQAIWELDCIPTGMEAFVASNESQWDVIKRVIDECDYYVLLVGGRYGSVTSEGISYTEKEYQYARERGLPVLAFVHAKPDDIPLGKSEKDEHLRAKLATFRAEVMDKYPVRTWSNAAELGGLVSRSLVREIKINPRPGWIRNDGSSPIALLEKINTLADENRVLREKSTESKMEIDQDLESGSDLINLYGVRSVTEPGGFVRMEEGWDAEVSWDDIFRDIGPALINEATETTLKEILARFHGFDETHRQVRSATIAPECWNEVIVQFRALGLVEQGTKKRGVNDRNSYWAITPKGDRHLVSLLARRRQPSESAGATPSHLPVQYE